LAPLLALQPVLAALRQRAAAPQILALAPLGLAYAVALIRFVGRRITPGWAPSAGWLNLDYVLLLAGVWALLSQAAATALSRARPVAPASVLGVGLLVLALGWTAWAGATLHTRGVTGTDPYAYTQMGIDLARTGTVRRSFPVVQALAGLEVDPRPLVPLGYVAPDPVTGASATVWAPGHAASLAVGYRLGGERGLYLTTPVLGLLALAALWLLAVEALRAWPAGTRRLAAGVAVALLATSFEQLDRQLTPMADLPAQLFSTLTLYWALRSARTRSLWPAALAGLCLGVAFDMRYTQVLLAPALAWVLVAGAREGGARQAVKTLGVCAGVAALAALPVLRYHQVAFGGPFRVGSEELALFSLDALRRTLPRMLTEFAQPREFRYALPLALLGALQLARRERRIALGLTLALGVVCAFHLLYEALRLRDLLPVLPVVALWAGVGVAELWSLAHRLRAGAWRAAAHAACVLGVALLVSSDATLLLPVPPMHYNAFGYLVDTQRASLDTLAALTEPDAVVAGGLNTGAVTLYAERAIVRPGTWSEREWLAVADHLLRQGTPLYLLNDGEEMRSPELALRARYSLEPIASLSLPYFFPGGGSENRDVPLYRIRD
ncbi:MAG: hypothetical protein GX557_07065, partial [Chloroflexi bacterium]|nr:hypothetical protein [Chloroflexota bacterium]